MNNKISEVEFRFQSARLDLNTVLELFAFFGFFSGVVSGVIGILFDTMISEGEGLLTIKTFIYLLSPLLSAIGAVATAFLGYPFYRYFANRYISLTLTGYGQRGDNSVNQDTEVNGDGDKIRD